MPHPSRLRLLDSTWFRAPGEIAGMALNPLSALTYIVLDRIGHPLLGGAAAVEATPELLLDYLWVHAATIDDLGAALAAPDPAAHVRAEALRLGADLAPAALDELAAEMTRATAELAAAATTLEDDGAASAPGKPPPSPTAPPPCSPPSIPYQDRRPQSTY